MVVCAQYVSTTMLSERLWSAHYGDPCSLAGNIESDGPFNACHCLRLIQSSVDEYFSYLFVMVFLTCVSVLTCRFWIFV